MKIIKAFLITIAIGRIAQLEATNILLVFCFGLFSYLCDGTLYSKEHKVRNFIACIFATLYVIGDYEQITYGLSNKLFQIGIVGATWLGLTCLFAYLIKLLYKCCTGWSVLGEKIRPVTLLEQTSIVGICLLAWLPYFLINYPGVFTNDSLHQFAQVLGIYDPSNHHPYVHTLIIGLFYKIGLFITNDITYAASFYTMAQMIFMSACVCYFYITIRKIGIKQEICYSVVAFYTLVPYHGYLASTIWKDTVFAGITLIFLTTMLRMIWEEKVNDITKKSLIIYGIAGIAFCLFRSNGWYAFLVVCPCVIYAFRNCWKKIVLLHISIIFIVLLIKGPFMSGNQVIQPDLAESLSIPLQQIGSVFASGEEISKNQNNFFECIMDTSQIPEVYYPRVSDGMKKLVRAGDQHYLEENFGEFIRNYVQMGIEHPMLYLQAYRDQTIGYWFPMQEGIIGGNEGVTANEFGLEYKAILKGPLVVKVNEIILKLKDIVPVYGALWCMGAAFWAIILAAGFIIEQENKKYLLVFIPCIAIIATLLVATPVADEFRYAYAYVICMPLLFISSFLGKEKQIENR